MLSKVCALKNEENKKLAKMLTFEVENALLVNGLAELRFLVMAHNNHYIQITMVHIPSSCV